jgi:hypothetical protein
VIRAARANAISLREFRTIARQCQAHFRKPGGGGKVSIFGQASRVFGESGKLVGYG